MTSTDDTQRLSLVDNPIENEFHAQRIEQVAATQPRRSPFWKGLFQRRRESNNEEEEDLEGSALLDSCTDLKYDSRRDDDEELDDYRDGEGDSSHRARLLASDDDDDDSEDEDEDSDHNGNVRNGTRKGYVSSTNDSLNMHSSAAVLRYSPETKGAANNRSDDDDDDDEDDDDEDDDESGDEEDEEANESNDEPIRYQPPQLAASSPIQPLRRFLQRSQSVSSNSYYSDHRSGDGDDGLTVDTSNRKNIHGRIEGFGNDPPRTPNQGPDPLPGARNLRQRLLELTSAYRMRKMAIGTEETIQRKTWVERFDDVVDRVLPADPELDGYIDAFKIAGQAVVVRPYEESSDPEDDHAIPPKQSTARSSLREPPVINIRPRGKGDTISHRRKALGNIDDTSYIRYLECELQNKELELNSWKQRLKELEAEVQRLKGLRDDDDDESQGSSSDSSNDEEKDQGESEIEWQTGVVEEGVLIEVERSPHAAALDMDTVAPHSKPSVNTEDTTFFVMSHAPDGPNGDPNGDEEAASNHQTLKKREETKNENGCDDDDFFPVLSSKNRESASIWTDEKPSTPLADSSSLVKEGSCERSDNDDIDDEEDNEDEEDQNDDEEDEGDKKEEDGEGEVEEEDEDDEEEDGEEDSEDNTKSDALVAPTEGLLITFDDDSPKMIPTSPAADLQVAVVSDDDDGAEENHASKSGELLVLDGGSTTDPPFDDTPSSMQSEVTLIDLE